jgi:16S rRNA (cytidine1402-2'-O)-methyltransferase
MRVDFREARVRDGGDDSTGGARRGALFVVATPIGNLQDLSPRALACLREADWLLAEDTRHTRRLLDAHGIARAPGTLESLHEHNERERTPELVARMAAGSRIALVADAGTPLLSDPGAGLVAAAAAAGIEVVSVPGPCAAIAALSIAGLPTESFAFEGFLPAKPAARRAELARLAQEPRTLVFYEAPHRLSETLADLAQTFGAERPASVARELTKRFEHVYRGTLAALAERSTHDVDMTRGELVLVVHGAPRTAGADTQHAQALRTLRALLEEELPVSQAARVAARLSGASRKELYEAALRMRDGVREPQDDDATGEP